MKFLIAACIMVFILSGCGKKSEPKYQGKMYPGRIIL